MQYRSRAGSDPHGGVWKDWRQTIPGNTVGANSQSNWTQSGNQHRAPHSTTPRHCEPQCFEYRLVGDSPAGAVVAQALAGAGHALVGRSAPPEDRADHVEALLPGVPVMDVEDIIRRSEMVILATDGDALAHVVADIDTKKLCQPGQIVCQLSPHDSLESLAPVMAQGAITVRLVPLLPLTGHSLDIRRLRGAWCGVVAHGPVAPIGQALALEMGMEALLISPEGEAAFNDSVALATEHTHSFARDALAPLLDAGVDHAPQALQSLLHATIDGIIRQHATEHPDGITASELLDMDDFGLEPPGSDPSRQEPHHPEAH